MRDSAFERREGCEVAATTKITATYEDVDGVIGAHNVNVSSSAAPIIRSGFIAGPVNMKVKERNSSLPPQHGERRQDQRNAIDYDKQIV